MAAKLGEVWIVQVKPASENGRVEQIPEAPAAPTAPGPDEAAAPTADAEEGAESAPAPPPAPEPVPLTEDKRHTLKGGELGKAERRESEFLLKTIARLVPGGTGSQPTGSTVAVLEPRPIEDPRDFVVVASGAEAAMSELEIEDIELDVGCVEICID
jgi:hypothetical protein